VNLPYVRTLFNKVPVTRVSTVHRILLFDLLRFGECDIPSSKFPWGRRIEGQEYRMCRTESCVELVVHGIGNSATPVRSVYCVGFISQDIYHQRV
jgi:hypothetical protein